MDFSNIIIDGDEDLHSTMLSIKCTKKLKNRLRIDIYIPLCYLLNV